MATRKKKTSKKKTPTALKSYIFDTHFGAFELKATSQKAAKIAILSLCQTIEDHLKVLEFEWNKANVVRSELFSFNLEEVFGNEQRASH
jgi:hypothetical protein